MRTAKLQRSRAALTYLAPAAAVPTGHVPSAAEDPRAALANGIAPSVRAHRALPRRTPPRCRRGRRGRRRGALHLRPEVFLRLAGREDEVAGVALGAPKSPAPGQREGSD